MTMDNDDRLEQDLRTLLHALTDCAESGAAQRTLVDQHFTPCAGFAHPLCIVPRRAPTRTYAGSREDLKAVYAVYKGLTRDIKIDVVRIMVKIDDLDERQEGESLGWYGWKDNKPPSSLDRSLLIHKAGAQQAAQCTQDGRRVIATATAMIDLRESLSAAFIPLGPRWFSRVYNLRLLTTLSLVKLSNGPSSAPKKESTGDGTWYVTFQHDAFPAEHLAETWIWPALPIIYGYRSYQLVAGVIGKTVGRVIERTGIW
ncbi:hypothetical protein BCR37DRAFT_114952 [Protomyces lactucae-debilis]|uniref:SigF-like NTF2-like domain-containing protein n=1 Tax=Protomyces lactucae-debilis TaxID=2754530 RepID=A0A1Y2F5E3_PROLT|nr:uncharacterized protein BCR37DRAFT_114952 [Protomyces lactucae-debilis]ORY78155.1 hypothetical protein BCR37DRAFT_114952 [Protomyces lactucae-debilis]